MVRCHQHKTNVRHVGAILQSGDVFENVVSIIGLTMIFALEELEFDSATPIMPLIIGKPKPDVNSSTFAIRAAQGLLEFDGECLTLTYHLEVSRCRDNPP
jgi:hypothetical protein